MNTDKYLNEVLLKKELNWLQRATSDSYKHSAVLKNIDVGKHIVQSADGYRLHMVKKTSGLPQGIYAWDGNTNGPTIHGSFSDTSHFCMPLYHACEGIKVMDLKRVARSFRDTSFVVVQQGKYYVQFWDKEDETHTMQVACTSSNPRDNRFICTGKYIWDAIQVFTPSDTITLATRDHNSVRFDDTLYIDNPKYRAVIMGMKHNPDRVITP